MAGQPADRLTDAQWPHALHCRAPMPGDVLRPFLRTTSLTDSRSIDVTAGNLSLIGHAALPARPVAQHAQYCYVNGPL